MADQAQLIKEALATGIIIERTDPNKNKKYYVNRKSKESYWTLTKEVVEKAKTMAVSASPVAKGNANSAATAAAAAAAAAVDEQRAVVRDERLEHTRKRAEIEAQLRASVSALERQKYDLEGELARIEGPVENEIEELDALRKELADARGSLDVVEKDIVLQRKKRHGDLHEIQSKVKAMQTLAESEKRHREAVEARHNTLIEEGFELRADIQKERGALEELKGTLELSEKRIIDAKATLRRQRELITQKEEEIARAESELKAVCSAKAEVDDDIKRYNTELEELNRRAGLRMSLAQQSLRDQTQNPSTNADGSSTQQLLFHLVTECEDKKRTLANLQRMGDRTADVLRTQEQNARLRHLTATFAHDRKKLEQLDRFLKHHLTQAHSWVLDAKAECLQVAQELAEMQRTGKI